MKTSDFDYSLPVERIAQTPIEPRHASRLLVLQRDSGEIFHKHFWDVNEFLHPGDLLVINQTRVIPARLFAQKTTGGKVEILLLKRLEAGCWEAILGGKGLTRGIIMQVEHGPRAKIEEVLDGPRRVIRFDPPVDSYLDQAGQMPLPPYIHTPLQSPERYQTVYARESGSAAAPTAGLHFTPELIQYLEGRGVRFARLTLHVGLDTFSPVREEDPQEHVIHTEWCELDDQAAKLINRTRREGGRVIAVGTTSVRTLETAAQAAQPDEAVGAFSGSTGLFILPGYTFKVVDAMITNFHLPCSTLLMLVSAFTGREKILQTYELAVNEGYRFYSFGDAMLIL